MNDESVNVPARRRPAWVWVIFVLVVLTSTYGLFRVVRFHLGAHTVVDELRRYGSMERARTPADVILVAGLMLNLVGAFLLISLRRLAFDAFVASLALNIIGTGVQLACGGPIVRLMQQGTVAVGLVVCFLTAFGWTLYAAICTYVWNLRRGGVLV